MKYNVAVVYQYTDYNLATGLRTVVRSKLLTVKFLPNSTDGWNKIMEILRKEHPDAKDILITNLIPLIK